MIIERNNIKKITEKKGVNPDKKNSLIQFFLRPLRQQKHKNKEKGRVKWLFFQDFRHPLAQASIQLA